VGGGGQEEKGIDSGEGGGGIAFLLFSCFKKREKGPKFNRFHRGEEQMSKGKEKTFRVLSNKKKRERERRPLTLL